MAQPQRLRGGCVWKAAWRGARSDIQELPSLPRTHRATGGGRLLAFSGNLFEKEEAGQIF